MKKFCILADSTCDLGLDLLKQYDIEYLQKHSILHTKKWEDFVETIKHKNRFHSNLIDQNLFKEYCLAISADIAVGNQRFYRGRISEKKEGFTPTNMRWSSAECRRRFPVPGEGGNRCPCGSAPRRFSMPSRPHRGHGGHGRSA